MIKIIINHDCLVVLELMSKLEQNLPIYGTNNIEGTFYSVFVLFACRKLYSQQCIIVCQEYWNKCYKDEVNRSAINLINQ